MKNWKLTVEYDGTKYHGWQKQINARTIQGELEKAAMDLLGLNDLEIGGSGRTDAGVHAMEQIAHLKIKPNIRIDTDRLMYGINDRLPYDINVLAVEEAPPSFHARHDAKTRSYLYQISRRRSAFSKRYVWWIREDLDIAKMARAAKSLAGRHDFSQFSQKDPSRPGESTIVVVEDAEIGTDEHLVLFQIEASHFLWKMVRRLTGTLVKLGKGEITEDQFADLLNGRPSKNLDVPAWTAPSSGLFLQKVLY
ncbi:MAG: tRNA pseudouridine(38-40) synthase TruA [Acidobacteria bacterium]|nr:tRNA pseudouridine(38-40) synthase TruA [Acidobacteriota bacterium]